ncbi:hypothetical protein CR152_30805 [Massilia violaceinigra]|uniref:Uncharacterized protein n=1 Tax=Massilia violaceinigra TaxID=2045208 RepID=A0A2D2DTV4_9BURK|nr:hypothetical protein [Massilia violaceinigra]ATQ78415.1 hypothetical protein CR152_30805 [Massilia violaceinigra]
MKCDIVGESDHDSGLSNVLYWLSRPEQSEAFAKDYGEGLGELVIDVICSKLLDGVKPRIRFAKKTKSLSMDIMLDYDDFAPLTAEGKKKRVLERLLEDVPLIVRKYKFADFNTELFLLDFNRYFSGLLAELPRTPALAA